MAKSEIELKTLKLAVNAVLDHLIEDIKLETIPIDPEEDFYWHCSAPGIYDASTPLAEKDLTVGRLSDDMHFIRLVRRGQGADHTINLLHITPLLRYLADRVNR
jgi:hypothetical protein